MREKVIKEKGRAARYSVYSNLSLYREYFEGDQSTVTLLYMHVTNLRLSTVEHYDV